MNWLNLNHWRIGVSTLFPIYIIYVCLFIWLFYFSCPHVDCINSPCGSHTLFFFFFLNHCLNWASMQLLFFSLLLVVKVFLHHHCLVAFAPTISQFLLVFLILVGVWPWWFASTNVLFWSWNKGSSTNWNWLWFNPNITSGQCCDSSIS